MALLDGGLKQVIGSALGGFLLDCTLHIFATVDDGMGGLNEVETGTFAAKGVVEQYSEFYRASLGIPETDSKIIMLQNGVDAEPTIRDQVTIRGTRWAIVSIDQDPAQASWNFQARPIGPEEDSSSG